MSSTPVSSSSPGGSPEQCEAGKSGAADQLLCLLQDPFSQSFKSTSIWTALATSVGFMLLIVLLFSLIRPRNNVVYAPKLKYADDKHAPPVIGKGLTDWAPPLLKLREAELVEKIGLDATVFLRFTKMCRNMFGILTIVACGLVLPTNLITGGKDAFAKSTKQTGFWITSTPQYTRGSVLWVHVLAAYLANMVVIFYLWRNYVVITRLRRGYFESSEYLQSLHSRTLMFIDIPQASRTDEGLLRLADEVEQTSGIPRAAIARNMKELPELMEQHEKAVRELESVLAKYLKKPDSLPAQRPTMRPGRDLRGVSKVDSIDYLMDRILDLETEIKHVRSSVDKRNPMPYGFASYERIEEAHTVAYAARNKKPHGTTICLAPRPNDLIWKNLPLSKKDKRWKRLINDFWILLLTVAWIAPNAMIAIFLSDLSHLSKVWKGFKDNYDRHHQAWAIVQGIASPAITSLLYLLLPIAFRRLSMHAGDITKTSRERHVASKLYAFFVFNNLIIFSAFSTVWALVAAVIHHPHGESVWDAIRQGYFFVKALGGLVEISPFWLTWLLQRNLGSAADLAQIIQLFWVWFGKTFTAPTPRQRIELTAPTQFDYAVYYNYFLFYATVALCFVTVQPLTVPITALYFVIDYWLKKYLLLYVLITKHESGGSFWRVLFNRMVFATILANFVHGIVVLGAGTWQMAAALVPLPFILLGFKFYCARTFDDQSKYYTKGILRDPENMADPGKQARRNDRVHKKFGNPALYAKLMTPMVHAKASRILPSLYGGNHKHEQHPAFFSASQKQQHQRVDSTMTDIAMDPMSASFPGKAAHFTPTHTPSSSTGHSDKKGLFELVPENKLDFGYFKSRSEFADEYGGDGELYGRPQDLVSEGGRSTPMSFMHGARDGSPSSSRASSPGPYGSPRDYRAFSPTQQLVQQQGQGVHPAYRVPTPQQQHERTGSSGSRGRGLYQYGGGGQRTESESNLLRAAQPNPVDDGRSQREMYGLDRWRTGGSGYAPVANNPAEFEEQGGLGTGMGFAIAQTLQDLVIGCPLKATKRGEEDSLNAPQKRPSLSPKESNEIHPINRGENYENLSSDNRGSLTDSETAKRQTILYRSPDGKKHRLAETEAGNLEYLLDKSLKTEDEEDNEKLKTARAFFV
ncbi:uncharacterized protein KY384_000710 [Bacidia gigantensis]|uniref:uncharacterized protein n=1 Tax=Bacidia gigantensis TaxID=2732470 RepID=UPI001D042E0C|nr:uncharacterized protein KY384_000710 [Bacidia gigantensis]KAG8525948.1 hypothetical protein KY384_000710 [Bacidia gigantensis]